MPKVLTKEKIVKTIQISKATTIDSLWHYMGYKSAINEKQIKTINKLVPNHLELLEENKKGQLVGASKTETQAVTPTMNTVVAIAVPAPAPIKELPVVAIPEVATVVPKKAKVVVTGKKEKVGGFRAGSHYAVLFAEGNKGYTTKEELIARVAKMTGRSQKLVTFDLNVMKYTDCKTNAGRAKVEEKNDKIKIVEA